MSLFVFSFFLSHERFLCACHIFSVDFFFRLLTILATISCLHKAIQSRPSDKWIEKYLHLSVLQRSAMSAKHIALALAYQHEREYGGLGCDLSIYRGRHFGAFSINQPLRRFDV